jgi:CubicO group peptidase (beta-lactamase class C family)
MSDKLAIETFNEHTLAGLALGVVRDGALEHFTGLGMADAAAGRPVERDTVFRIGSISKTMTAVAILQLVEDGELELDAAVNDLGTRARIDGPAPVTVRHLLTHTSGLGELRRPSDLVRPVIGLGAKPGEPPPTLHEYYARPLRTAVEPGTKWAYANHGFALLGLIVEDLRGRPFPAVMRERIFEPLGMEHSDFERTPRVRERLAVGYQPARKGFKPVKDLEIVVGPAGACFSTTADMARYAAALAGGGAPLLRPESLARMLEPQGEPDPDMPAMGLAFFLGRTGGHRVAGHDGGWPGFVSALAFAPDTGTAVVAFTNTSTAFAPHVLAERVLQGLLEAHADAPAVAQHPHAWRDLIGLYKLPQGLNTNFRWWPLIGGEVEIAVRKGRLVARAPSPVRQLRKGVPLHAIDAADPLRLEARVEDWAVPVVFERGAQGDVVAVRAGSTRGGLLRLHRRSRAASLRLWARAGAGAGSLAAAVAAWRRVR